MNEITNEQIVRKFEFELNIGLFRTFVSTTFEDLKLVAFRFNHDDKELSKKVNGLLHILNDDLGYLSIDNVEDLDVKSYHYERLDGISISPIKKEYWMYYDDEDEVENKLPEYLKNYDAPRIRSLNRRT